ncbi:hypothetical protein, conserved [Leishmania tarentolae]|uniref:Uncharacterized protein n=1 Tax=Leishmania tarentolae TaxID=5689 RepID=A0A640KR72_LEITA|nr:hypothetical protein, conserved [Leishmania tarentolae]
MKGVTQRGLHGSSLAMSRSKGTSKGPHRHGHNGAPRYAAASPSPRTAAALIPPTAQQLQHAPLVAFTQWNETAMEALRNGDGDSSRRILSTLLPVLDARLHAMQCKSSAQTSPTVIEAWRLAHALTLNNYGCQLRRDGLTDEALHQFQRAKQVETLVFGKPSCSTMLNLSAVLLSSGATKEALTIAKDCVMAAQDGEPILFITALHNLAVALGQQTSERERKAALPTMLQALREAQSTLGEKHETTLMLKEKCGLTSGWISQDNGAEVEPEGAAPMPVAESPSPHRTFQESAAAKLPSTTPLTAQESARAALHTLNFGEPVHTHPIVHALAVVDAAKPAHGDPNREEPRACPTSPSRHLLDADPRSQRYVGKATQDGQVSLRSPPQHPAHVDSPERADAVYATHLKTTATKGDTPDVHWVSSRRSSAAASVHQYDLESVNLSCTQYSIPSTPLETVVQEPFQVARLVMSRSVTNVVGPAGSIGDLYKSGDDSTGGPCFLRFSLPPPLPLANTVSLPLRKLVLSGSAARPSGTTSEDARGRKPSPATMPRCVSKASSGNNRESCTVTKAITITPTAEARGTVEKGEKSVPEGGRDGARPSLPKRSLFGGKGSSYTRRIVNREVEKQEERAYRIQREAEKKAEEAENAFQLAFEKLQHRTQSRAATIIQHAWRQWWNAVGRKRREVQLRRLEELQRRRRERLALGLVAGKMSERPGKVTIPPPPSKQHGDVGGHLVPAVVLRCWRNWLSNTICVRYVAKSHRSRVDARLHEADVRHCICRIQALWRGVIARQRRPKHQQQPQLYAENATSMTKSTAYLLRAKDELREYSALVLQMAYRSYRARQLRHRLYLAKHEGPAKVIQRWLRCTWADHRNRGVDRRTVCMRNAAAITIQRMWRGFLGRVAFHMRQLRLRMDRVGAPLPAIEAGSCSAQRLGVVSAPECRTAKHLSTKTSRPSSASDRVKKVADLPPAGNAGFFTAGKGTPDSSRTAVPTEAYAAACLQRSDEVYRLRDMERNRYHIGLYVDVMASKERQAWQESLRLRPTEVLRRRVQLDTQIHEEQRAFTEHRAAVAIQRAYRTWRRMKEDKSRDTNYLYYSRAFYQQRELGSLAARKQRQRDTARAIALYGDSARVMREERVKAAEELALVTDCNGPASSTSGPNGVIAVPREGAKIASYAERMARKKWRQENEAMQRRDEVLVALTYPHDMAHAREGPEECAARLGTTYEHPYYIPYVNGEHYRTLGID